MSEYDLTAKVRANLTQYTKEIQDGIKKITDSVSDELKTDLRRDSPRRKGDKLRGRKGGKQYAPGSYAKSWNTKVTSESFSIYTKTAYNRTHYRLTHLLEKGHKARNGSHVEPIKHIAPLERKAAKSYESKIIKLIKSIE